MMRPGPPSSPCRARSVNHSAPSGPAVMLCGSAFAVGIGNSVNTPAVVSRPIWPALTSVNQIAPSGPAQIPLGKLFAVGPSNSVNVPVTETRTILFVPPSANRHGYLGCHLLKWDPCELAGQHAKHWLPRIGGPPHQPERVALEPGPRQDLDEASGA